MQMVRQYDGNRVDTIKHLAIVAGEVLGVAGARRRPGGDLSTVFSCRRAGRMCMKRTRAPARLLGMISRRIERGVSFRVKGHDQNRYAVAGMPPMKPLKRVISLRIWLM